MSPALGPTKQYCDWIIDSRLLFRFKESNLSRVSMLDILLSMDKFLQPIPRCLPVPYRTLLCLYGTGMESSCIELSDSAELIRPGLMRVTTLSLRRTVPTEPQIEPRRVSRMLLSPMSPLALFSNSEVDEFRVRSYKAAW